jgi:lipid-A-disaccharide synthase
VTNAPETLKIALIAGEASGDQLGAALMDRLREQRPTGLSFIGIGGPLMQSRGLVSYFPISELSVNGFVPVLKNLPRLLHRIRETADRLASDQPDVVVHIDAQDFNKRVAAKLRRKQPAMPLIGYVSPTVWAWRPGRARKIAKLYDHLLALFPFEPEVHRQLGGPPTTYVGHPLLARPDLWQREASESATLAKPLVLLLPGSRRSEVERLLPAFLEAGETLKAARPEISFAIPVVQHLKGLVEATLLTSRLPVTLIESEDGKWAAFRQAAAALAASGTVSLELALANVPQVIAYRVAWLEEKIAERMITGKYASLPNVILDRPLVPEFYRQDWTADMLLEKLLPLIDQTPERAEQLAGFDAVRSSFGDAMHLQIRAASIVLASAKHIRKVY